MRLTFLGFAAALMVAPTALAQTAQTPPPPPTCDAPEHRALDFWIGEWDVYATGTDTLAGRSSIQSAETGCVITEIWRGEGFTGRSLNIYDRETARWEQFWVSSIGGVTHFIGGPTEDGMVLTAPQARIWLAPGAVFQSRMTLTPLPDGSVRQHGETSSDGETWTTRYDYNYRRRPE